MTRPILLPRLFDRLAAWALTLRRPEWPAGAYAPGPGGEPSFYASTDLAILRWVCGEDLRARPEAERAEWAAVINAYQQAGDGRYGPFGHRHVLHANGMAANALCILGRRHRHPVAFYNLFNTPERIGPWLSQIHWRNPWSASHLIWGGPVLWNNSARATAPWRAALFAWLDDQRNGLGSWPRDLGAGDDNGPIAPIGCAVHIWPLYRHLGLPVPGLEPLTDTVLSVQKPHGRWGRVGFYSSMDCLYVLAVAAEAGLRAGACRDAAARYLAAHFDEDPLIWQDAHWALSWASCLGYLRRLLPDEFAGEGEWRDIFDDRAIYDLDAILPEVEA